MALPFHPQPKPEPRIVATLAKRKTKEARARDFRRAVWIRDHGRSRASGKQLARSGVTGAFIGEVHHVLARSTNPDKLYDVSNGLLLSRDEHLLAEAHCQGNPTYCYLSISGPKDRGQPQTFRWRNAAGDVLRTRIG